MPAHNAEITLFLPFFFISIPRRARSLFADKKSLKMNHFPYAIITYDRMLVKCFMNF